jgi:poly-gamma-glutamate synthesis protein (capsule biosynthesis protein)
MEVRLFLCGDVMTGRGIDQILPHPSAPQIHEPYLKSALDYVRLAEETSGPIPRRVEPSYIWGEALEELERAAPAARVINLETAVTASDAWEAKGINYRMSPANVRCLNAARIDCCALANNHVLDWGPAGLAETLETLRGAGIRASGAGRTAEEAEAPAAIELAAGGRVLVLSVAAPTSGVPQSWAARAGRPGVAYLKDLSARAVQHIAQKGAAVRRPGDLVIASLHWGPNWGYDVWPEEQRFARALLDAGVDVVHGHSSHHAKGIEVYRGKLILYGCGDLINDYEGIGGHEDFRGDLGLMYFPRVDAGSGKLAGLDMTPVHMRRFRLERVSEPDAGWLCEMLEREGRRFGTGAKLRADGRIELRF